MPLLFNEDKVAPVPLADGVTVKRLLTPERTGNDMISLDLWSVPAGAVATIATGAQEIQALQLLSGQAHLRVGGEDAAMTPDHIAFLPPNATATLRGDAAATVLAVGTPSAPRHDKAWDPAQLRFKCTDWSAEPVLDSKHDTRKRIYLVTPVLNNTRALKGEMIIYPPLSSAPNHHHEGAEHFQYVLRGSATVYLSEQPHKLRAGDVLYNYEFERHAFLNDGGEEFVFVEYFVPGDCVTIWADESRVCTWMPTGRNLRGDRSTREIAAHSSAEEAADV